MQDIFDQHTDTSINNKGDGMPDITKNTEPTGEEKGRSTWIQTNNPVQLGELENQIKAQFDLLGSLEYQYTTPVVERMVELGLLFNDYEIAAGTKPNYTKLIREKFGADKFQLIQQSRRLAAYPVFCKDYSYLGKNRLLTVVSYDQDDDAKAIMAEYPPPDTDDCDAVKVHVDGVITLCRMDKKDIKCVSLEQAKSIARIKKHALEVSQVTKLQNKLNEPGIIDKAEYVDKWIANGLVWKNPKAADKPSDISKIIAQVNKISTKIGTNDTNISTNDLEEIRKAYEAILNLAEKFKPKPSI